jgi:hypothetical protein
VLDRALAARLRASLRARVETVWIELGGPACLDGEAALEDAETFFDRLDAIEEAGDLADSARLAEQLEDLYGTPDLSSPDAVQLLTIHKSKGLELSTVIVPGLDRAPRAGDAPLFRWKTRADGALLMAPIAAAGTKGDAAYDYLRTLDAREEGTRPSASTSRSRGPSTGCTCSAASVDGKPGTRRARRPAIVAGRAEVLEPALCRRRRRGPAAVAANAIAPAPPPCADCGPAGRCGRTAARRPPRRSSTPWASVEFSWAGEARHVGTVAHRWLQRIAQEALLLGRRASPRSPGAFPPISRSVAFRPPSASLLRRVLTSWRRHRRRARPVGPRRAMTGGLRGPGRFSTRRVRLLVMDRVFTAGGRALGRRLQDEPARGRARAFSIARAARPQMPLRGRSGARRQLALYFPLVPG